MEKKKKFLDGFEDNLLLIPLVISIVLVLAGFVTNLFGASAKSASTFCIQLSYYAFAWYVALVLAVTIRERMYLNINVFGNLFPAGIKMFVAILNEVIEFVVIVFFFVFSFYVCKNCLATGQMNASAPELPAIVAYSSAIVGFAFALFRKIERIIKEGIKA